MEWNAAEPASWCCLIHSSLPLLGVLLSDSRGSRSGGDFLSGRVFSYDRWYQSGTTNHFNSPTPNCQPRGK